MQLFSLYFEIIAVIFAILNYKKFKNTHYRFFIYFLIYVVITELTGATMKRVFHVKNHLPYNIYIIVSTLFYFYFYKHLLKNNKIKKIISAFTFVFLGFYLYEVLVIKTHFFNGFYFKSFVVGGILMVVVLILFLIEIINNEKLVFNIKKALIFWISVGLLLFYIGMTPIIISTNILNYNITHISIITLLNLIMYGLFSVGFVLSDKKYNY